MAEAGEITNRTGEETEGGRAAVTPQDERFYCVIEGCPHTFASAQASADEVGAGFPTFEGLAQHAAEDHGFLAAWATTASSGPNAEEIVYIADVAAASEVITIGKADLPMTLEEAADLGIIDASDVKPSAPTPINVIQAGGHAAMRDDRCVRCGNVDGDHGTKIKALLVQRTFPGGDGVARPVGEPQRAYYCGSCEKTMRRRGANLKVTAG